MTNDGERKRMAAQLLEDESLLAKLRDDEAKVLVDWAMAEIGSADGVLDDQVSRLRRVMAEINELVGNRQNLVADDLEERMGSLLVGDLDPKSHLRLERERDIAQVTAEKDHIEGAELVRRLTAIASKTWRAKDNAQPESGVQTSAIMDALHTGASLTGTTAPRPAVRARPIPRPTKVEPHKPGLLDRLLGRK